MPTGEPLGPPKSRLRASLDWIGQPGGAPIDAWRRRILAAVLLGCCVFGGLAFAIGATAAWANGERAVVVFDTIIYSGVLVLTLRRSLSYRVRAGVVTALPLMLGVYFLWRFGFMASGFPWLLSFPVFASVLFGLRASIRAIIVTAVILIGMGFLIPTGILGWVEGIQYPVVMWTVSSSGVLMIDVLLALSVGYLFEGLGNEVIARRAAELEADRRQRLAVLGTITGGIAHDFNNLLQPIVSDAEHAQRVVAAGEDPTELLDDILQTSERARALVRRILGFARPPVGQRDVMELGALVTETERLLPALLPPHVSLQSQVQESVYVAAEPSELQQVLINLVNNSAQAMPQGGVVRLSVDQVDASSLRHHVDLVGTPLAGLPTLARLTVQDTGVGMDSATLARMFEPFYTTKGPQRGSGLGLATVHATVTALGGIVRPTSVVGQGTRMDVLLPALPAPIMKSIPTPPASLPAILRTDERATPALAFVVDDEPAVLNGTARLLERVGFVVRRFGVPAEAVEALAEQRPVLILTDLAMPDMSGWDVAAFANDQHPGLPVIVMTGHLDTPDEDLSVRPGVSAILPKPFTSAELETAIRAHVLRT